MERCDTCKLLEFARMKSFVKKKPYRKKNYIYIYIYFFFIFLKFLVLDIIFILIDIAVCLVFR